MADWIVTREAGARSFPTVRHRHPNGTLDAVRDPTPSRFEPLGGRGRGERWTFVCPCGEVYVWDRATA